MNSSRLKNFNSLPALIHDLEIQIVASGVNTSLVIILTNTKTTNPVEIKRKYNKNLRR